MFKRAVKKSGKVFAKYFEKYYWVILPLLILVFFAKPLIYVGMIVIGSLLPAYRRFFPFPLGIELNTFFGVTIFYAYGFFWAVLALLIMILVGTYIRGSFDHVPVVVLIRYAVVLILLIVLGSFGVVRVGKIAAVVGSIVLFAASFIMINFLVLRAIPAFFINIYLNFYLFTNFGESYVSLLEAL